MDLKRDDGKNTGHIDHGEKSATGKEKISIADRNLILRYQYIIQY